jgi:nitrous oxide reductase accessory protein NosL
MKSKVNMLSAVALGVLLAGCQTRTNEPVEQPHNVVETQDITVTEMEPDD